MSSHDVGGCRPSDAASSPAHSSSHGLDAHTDLADAEITAIQLYPNPPNPCCRARQENLERAAVSIHALSMENQELEALKKTNEQMSLQMAEQSTYIENNIQHQHDLQMQMDRAIAERNVAVQHEQELERQMLLLERNSATLRKKADQADSLAAKYQHLVVVAEELQQKRVKLSENSKKVIQMTTDLKSQIAKQEQMIAQLKLDKTALTHRLRSCKKYVPMMLKTIDELVPLAGDSMAHYTKKRVDALAQEGVRLQLVGSQAVPDDGEDGSDEEMAGDLEHLISSGVKVHWSPKKKQPKIEQAPPATTGRSLDDSGDEMDVPGTSGFEKTTPRIRTITAEAHRGRGGRTARRGRANAYDLQQIDREHEALLRNKLLRGRDEGASDTPTASSSIHGKKGLTVREQQELQRKGMTVKEKVALMRKPSIERIPSEANHRLEDSFRMPWASKTPLVLPESPARNQRGNDLFSELQMSPSPVKSKTSVSESSTDVPTVEEHNEVTFSLNDASDLFDDYDMSSYSTMDQLDSLVSSASRQNTPAVEVNPLAPEVVAEKPSNREPEKKEEKAVVGIGSEETMEEEKTVEEEETVFTEVAEETTEQNDLTTEAPELSVAPPTTLLPVPTEAPIAKPVKSPEVSVPPAVAPSPLRNIIPSMELTKATIVPSPSLPHLEAEWPSAATIRALEAMEMIASELEPPLTPVTMRKPFVSEPTDKSSETNVGETTEKIRVPRGSDSKKALSPVKKSTREARKAVEAPSEEPDRSQVTKAEAGVKESSPMVSPVKRSARVARRSTSVGEGGSVAQKEDAQPTEQSSQENGPTPVARSRQTRVKQPQAPAVPTSPRKRRLSSTSKALPDAVPPTPKAKETPRSRKSESKVEEKSSPAVETPLPKIIPPRAATLPRKTPVRPALVAAEPICRRSARTAVAAPRVSRVTEKPFPSVVEEKPVSRRSVRLSESTNSESEKDAVPEKVPARRVAHRALTKNKPEEEGNTSEKSSPSVVKGKPVARRTTRASQSEKGDSEKDAVPEKVPARRVAHSALPKNKPTEEANTNDNITEEPADSPYVPTPVSAPASVPRSLSLPTRRPVDPLSIQRIIITDEDSEEDDTGLLVEDQEPEEAKEADNDDSPSKEVIEKKDEEESKPKEDEDDDEPKAGGVVRPVVKKAMTLGGLIKSLPRGAPVSAQMNNLTNALAKKLRQGGTAALASKTMAKKRVAAEPKPVTPKAVSKETATTSEQSADFKSPKVPASRKISKPVPILPVVPPKPVSRRVAAKRTAEAAAIPSKRLCLAKNSAEGLLEKALDMDCEYDIIRKKMSEAELGIIRELPADTFGRIMAEVAIRRPTGNMFHSVIASYRKKEIIHVHNKSEETLMQASFSLCADDQNVFAPFIQGLLTHLVSHSTTDPTVCHKIVRLVALAVQAESQLQFDNPVFGSNPEQVLSAMLQMIAYEHPILLGEALIYLLLQSPANFLLFLTEEESETLRRIVVLYSDKVVCEIACWYWGQKFFVDTGRRLSLPKPSDLDSWLEELALTEDDLFIDDGQLKVSESAVAALRIKSIYVLTTEGAPHIQDEVAATENTLNEMIQHYDIGEKPKLEGMGDLFTDNVRRTHMSDVSFDVAHRLALLLKTLCSYGMRLFEAKEIIGPVKTRKIIDGIGSCCESTRLLHKHLQGNPPRSPELGVLLSAALSEFLDEYRVLSQHPF